MKSIMKGISVSIQSENKHDIDIECSLLLEITQVVSHEQ